MEANPFVSQNVGSLIEKALVYDIQKHTGSRWHERNITSAHIDLLKAYLNGEVSLHGVASALGMECTNDYQGGTKAIYPLFKIMETAFKRGNLSLS